MTRRVMALALAGLAFASGDAVFAGDAGHTLTDEELYDYSCGHLGTSCNGTEPKPKPRKRAASGKRGCGRGQRRAPRRAREDGRG